MGFCRDAAVRALAASKNNVEAAVESLITGAIPDGPDDDAAGGDAGSGGFSAQFVIDDSLPDGVCVPQGSVLDKRWIVRNSGKVAWPAGAGVEFISGNLKGTSDRFGVGVVAPGANVVVSVKLMSERGSEGAARSGTSVWQLSAGPGEPKFGDQLWCDLLVGQKHDFGLAQSQPPQADPAGPTDPASQSASADARQREAELERLLQHKDHELRGLLQKVAGLEAKHVADQRASSARLDRAATEAAQSRVAIEQARRASAEAAGELARVGIDHAAELEQVTKRLTARVEQEREASGRGEETVSQLRAAHEQRDAELAAAKQRHTAALEAEKQKHADAVALLQQQLDEALRDAAAAAAQAAAAAAAVRAPDSDSDSDGAVEVTIDIPVKIEVPQHESRVDPASYTYAQHVVYEVKIQYHGESWTIFRRYSEFAQLVRELLSKAVAEFELPELPAKQYGLFQPTEEFLVERRGGLEMFLQQLVAGTWTDPASPFFEITQERLQEEFPFFRVDAAAPDVGASDPAGPSDPDATNPYADGMVAGPTGETGATPAGADQSAEGAEPAAASDANAEAEKPRSWFW